VVSSTNKTDRYDITEILLKFALNTITVALIVDIGEITFSVVTICAQFTGFDSASGRYNGGNVDDVHFSGLREIRHFIRPGTHVLISSKDRDEA
jgi:hypothetical protein